VNKEGILKPSLIAGVLLGILSAIPVIKAGNCLCCAWVIGGGILASYLYVKSSAVAVTLGRGVGLGLLAGAIGAVVETAFSIPLELLLSKIGLGAADQIRQLLEQFPQLPRELRQALLSLSEGGKGIGVTVLVAVALPKLVLYSVIAMLGGVCGVAIFEKREKHGHPPAEPPVYRPPIEPPTPPADGGAGQPPTP
jgi:hypothetical protein